MSNTNNEIYQNYNSSVVLPLQVEDTWSRDYFKHYLLPHFPSSRDADILEIGCGYGRYLKFLEENGYKKSCGIDISPDQIEYGKKKLGLSNIFQKDPLDFFKENQKKYDVIMLIDILEHLDLDYTIKLLKGAKETLNDKGILLIHVPNAISPFSVTYHGDITHKHSFSAQSLSQLLRMTGFEHMEHFPLPPWVHGVKSFVRRVLWSGIVNPMITLLLLIANGNKMGGIYTSNFLTIVHRR